MNESSAVGRILPITIVLLLLMICLSSCASSGGIFSGGKWQSGGLQQQLIQTLAVDPNNPQVMYAGDAQEGVFLSTNSGKDWSKQSTGFTLPIFIFGLGFDDAGKKLYAATNEGVFVSSNAAKNWIGISGLPVDSYTALAFDLKDAHIIYTATKHHGIYVSTNEGSSWTSVNRGLPTGIIINNLAFDSEQHQLWAATNLGIYRSTNSGELWQSLNNGLPSNVVVNSILPAVISGGDKSLVFSGTNHGFFRSQTDGTKWFPSQESLSGTSVKTILIDYHKVTTVYVGTEIGVLRSDDNGQNWGGIASGLPKDQSVQALAIGANGYNQLYAASKGIYLFPGNSSVFDPSQIFPVLLMLAFFFILYRLTLRGRKRTQQILIPESKVETNIPSPLGYSQTNTNGSIKEVENAAESIVRDNETNKEMEI